MPASDIGRKPSGWNSLEEDTSFPNWQAWPGAVLLSDEIERYAKHPHYPLISPFDSQCLKPARYQLHIGDEARVGGKKVGITKVQPLRLPPHQVAIVRTKEQLNIPRFLIARWNLTVGRVYEGLLWVGALQVDPGWVGYLPCPLYNLSDEEVVLEHGSKLFTVDFVRTTPFVPDRCKRYENEAAVDPPLKTFDTNRLESGPYQALKQLDELREFRSFAGGLIAVIFTALAAVTAAMGIVATRPASEGQISLAPPVMSWWPTAALSMSVAALVFSIGTAIFAFNRTRKH